MLNPIKVLFVAPHLSTGGMPAFLLKRIECLQKYTNAHIQVVEFKNYSDDYVVQKNKIKQLVPVTTLGENKMQLIDIIKSNHIDIVHIDEIPEGFDSHNTFPTEVLKELYSPNRTWRIVETCHNVWFNPDQSKLYHPDAYAFCTPYHTETFKNMPSVKDVIEFPISDRRDDYSWSQAEKELGFDPDKIHVVNIGLWTPGKNQAEAIEVARANPDKEFHFVGNQAENFKSYWEPLMKTLPKNCKVWGERDDAWKFLLASNVFMFNSTWECNPLVIREAISYGCKILARDLPQYMGMFDGYITPIKDGQIDNQLNLLIKNRVEYSIPEGQDEVFANKHIELYKKILLAKAQTPVINITTHFVGQPFLEIKGNSDELFTVEWYDGKGLVYRSQIGCNQWTRLNKEYYNNWRVIVLNSNAQIIYDHTYDDKGKRVYISFDSKSLGDTIAWIPYCEEYRKNHGCELIVSTFWNKLLRDIYPDIEFVEPGTTVHNLYAMYNLGWFYNSNKEPVLPNTIPLQKAATNILGLEYRDIRPELKYNERDFDYGKYVTIAPHSTAGCKLWDDDKWAEVINYLLWNGYNVVNVSKEGNKFMNVITPKDSSIEHTMDLIGNSEFFIGLSSGLSWLAWALHKPVFMISNFTEIGHEFACHRIANTNVCHGCWNKPEYKFDKGDWNWCPVNKGTGKQFECHKSITAQMVIDTIEKAGV